MIIIIINNVDIQNYLLGKNCFSQRKRKIKKSILKNNVALNFIPRIFNIFNLSEATTQINEEKAYTTALSCFEVLSSEVT